jgi:hypothetical protein
VVPSFRWPFCPDMPSSPTPGSSPSISSRQRRRHGPSPSVDRLGTPETPANPFRAGGSISWLQWFAHLLRPARLLAPLNGSDRITPTIGDFYFWASGGSVTLPVSRYNYSSDWTPLLAGLAPAGTAASFAAPTLATKRTLRLTWAGLPPAGSHQLAAGALIRSPLGKCRSHARSTARRLRSASEQWPRAPS